MGRSYQEPLVIIPLDRGRDEEEKKKTTEEKEKGKEEGNERVDRTQLSRISSPSSSHDLTGIECVHTSTDTIGFSENYYDESHSPGVEMEKSVKKEKTDENARKRKKEKKEKKEKKGRKAKKEKKEKRHEGKESRGRNLIMSDKSEFERGKKNDLDHANFERKEQKSEKEKEKEEEKEDSDSSTDWSSDEETETFSMKKMKQEQNSNSNRNNNQLATSNSTKKRNFIEAEFNRNFIFLPNGEMMVTASSAAASAVASGVIRDGEGRGGGEEGWGGVTQMIDRRGDKSIILHGVYLHDIPTYSLYIGHVNTSHSFPHTSTSTSISTSLPRIGEKYCSSFSLAKKNHILPSGAMLCDENVSVFRPLEKTLHAQKHGKFQILNEIRLKKKDRYFIAGTYQIDREEGSDVEKEVVGTGAQKGKKRRDKKGFRRIDNILSDVSVKRIRFEFIRKQKIQNSNMDAVGDYNNDDNNNNCNNNNSSSNNNDNNNFISNYSINNNNNNSIITSTYQSDQLLNSIGTSGFLGSDYLPLPPFTIAGIDTEFAVKNTDIKSVKLIEKKLDRSAFFGFGGGGNGNENESQSLLEKKREAERDKEREQELEREKEKERENKRKAEVFSTDAEVLLHL